MYLTNASISALFRRIELFAALSGLFFAHNSLKINCFHHWDGFYFIEAPLPADNIEGYARLSDAVDTRIAVGDWGFSTRFEFEDLMDRGRVDVVQPSAVRAGGIREITRIAEAAFRRGLLCVPHSWCHMVGVAAEIHLAAVLPNMPFFETPIAYPDSPIISELLDPLPKVDQEGFIEVPSRPGLGFELNEEVIRRFKVDPH